MFSLAATVEQWPCDGHPNCTSRPVQHPIASKPPTQPGSDAIAMCTTDDPGDCSARFWLIASQPAQDPAIERARAGLALVPGPAGAGYMWDGKGFRRQTSGLTSAQETHMVVSFGGL
jgi:hypothetical protein